MHNHPRVRKEPTRLARHVNLQVCRVRGYTHCSVLQHLTVANEWLLSDAVNEWQSIKGIYAELPRWCCLSRSGMAESEPFGINSWTRLPWRTANQCPSPWTKRLDVIEPDGYIDVEGARSCKQPRLWLVGYGYWTGLASATLIVVMRSARATAKQIAILCVL